MMTVAIIVLSIALVILLALVIILGYANTRLLGQIDIYESENRKLSDKVCLQQELVFLKYEYHIPYSVRALERSIGELNK